jgi:hypothetical protein
VDVVYSLSGRALIEIDGRVKGDVTRRAEVAESGPNMK